MRVLVALSGGVDSAAALCILQKQGHEVSAVSMALCGVDGGAEPVAAHCGVPLKVLDWSDLFERVVIEPSVRSWAEGLTPNPCVFCNKAIKFGALLDYALESGFDALATGHYVRIVDGCLLRAVDEKKDQSYMLWSVSAERLRRVITPLGGITKETVRKRAAEWGIPCASRPDSQDLCFVRGETCAGFLDRQLGCFPGDIVDFQGTVLGRHLGLSHYTIGQRHGLRLSSVQPLYVLKKDTQTNSVAVGPESRLYARGLRADCANWFHCPDGQMCEAKVRYSGGAFPAVLCKETEIGFSLRFREPIRAITPGQSVVLYRGDSVLGGGIIREVLGEGCS